MMTLSPPRVQSSASSAQRAVGHFIASFDLRVIAHHRIVRCPHLSPSSLTYNVHLLTILLPPPLLLFHVCFFSRRAQIDDDFRVGISIGSKAVRLYAPFYSADIIVASPLGLRRIIGGEGDAKRETDFLSSMEVVILGGGAEVMRHQNWDHVRSIFASLNTQPSSTGETDFSRVRQGDLDGTTPRFTRQTIAVAGYMEGEVTSLLRGRKYCSNVSGGVLVRPLYAGTISRVVVPGTGMRHTFTRVAAASMGVNDDVKLAHFKARILPELVSMSGGSSAGGGGVLIYAPSYFAYVRLRNMLDAAEVEFVTLCEYTEDGDVARAKSRFAGGHTPIMLLSERFHYFRRTRIRGVRHVVWFGPPSEAHFYSEILNWVGGSNAGAASSSSAAGSGGAHTGSDAAAGAAATPVSSLCLFSRYDQPALERVVGSSRCGRMVDAGNPKATFFFV